MRERGRQMAAAGIVATAALAARLIEAAQDVSIMNDAPRFISSAEAWLRGDLGAVFRDDFHPGMGAAMALLGWLTGIELETAGRAISVASGTLSSVVLFALVRDTLALRVALAAGILFAVHPPSVLAASSVQNDSLHQFLALAGALAAWRALERGRVKVAVAAGVCCGLAYLVRPEGLVVAVVMGSWLCAEAARRRLDLRRVAALGSAFALALLATAAPYAAAVHAHTNEWSLTQKKSTSAMLSLEQPVAPIASDERKRPSAVHGLAAVAAAGLRAVNPVFFALCLLGLPRRRPSRAELYLLSYPAVMLLVLLLLQNSYGYVSHRHWLLGAGLLLPFAAGGLIWIADGLSSLVHRSASPPRTVGAILVVAAISGLAHIALEQEDPLKAARAEAARWLRQHADVNALAAPRSRVAWYAGAARFVELPRDSDGQRLVNAALEAKADFLIAEESRLGTDSGEALQGAEPLHEVAYEGGRVLVLRLFPADSPVAGPSAVPRAP